MHHLVDIFNEVLPALIFLALAAYSINQQKQKEKQSNK
jgi:hypothetical protein